MTSSRRAREAAKVSGIINVMVVTWVLQVLDVLGPLQNIRIR